MKITKTKTIDDGRLTMVYGPSSMVQKETRFAQSLISFSFTELICYFIALPLAEMVYHTPPAPCPFLSPGALSRL